MGMSSPRLWLRMLASDPRLSLQSSQVPSGMGVNIQVSVQLALMMPRLPCALSNGGSWKLAVPYKKVALEGNGICCWLNLRRQMYYPK